MIDALLATTGALLALRYRVPQVAAFATVAAVRQARRREPLRDWAALNDLWEASSPSATPFSLEPGRCATAITYHPWYDDFEPQRVVRRLEAAAALDARMLRADVRWSDVVPDGTGVSVAALEWHRRFFETALDRFGLTPLVVLSNPAAPILELADGPRLHAWERYVSAVAESLSRVGRHYQVFNEPNNPVYRFFDPGSQARALTAAVRQLRRVEPDASVAVNFLVGLPRWRRQLEDLLAGTGEQINVVGLDAYPGTWDLSWGFDWRQVVRFVDDVAEARTGPWRGRRLAVMETGYSTNLPLARDEGQQVAFLDSLASWLEPRASHFAVVSLYELNDAGTSVWFDPEAHFGLLTSEARPKAGFERARALFSRLNATGTTPQGQEWPPPRR
jgi:hypothetical protein